MIDNYNPSPTHCPLVPKQYTLNATKGSAQVCGFISNKSTYNIFEEHGNTEPSKNEISLAASTFSLTVVGFTDFRNFRYKFEIMIRNISLHLTVTHGTKIC